MTMAMTMAAHLIYLLSF